MLSTCPLVTVFHDLQHKRHPEYFRWFDLPFWRAFLYASARRSKLIIAVSEATRRDFIAHYKVDPSRVRVVHHGVDAEFFGIRERLPHAGGQRYILTVSTLHPHKNFQRLLLAYADFLQKQPDVKLVIAGLVGFRLGANRPIDYRTGSRGEGHVSRVDSARRALPAVCGADAFVYPTTFEGFGMTLLEGLAAGLPVACSDIEPVRSLAGNAALLFDPQSTGDIENAMLRITGDEELRGRLRKAGPVRAREFSWDETARLTLECLVEAAGRG